MGRPPWMDPYEVEGWNSTFQQGHAAEGEECSGEMANVQMGCRKGVRYGGKGKGLPVGGGKNQGGKKGGKKGNWKGWCKGEGNGKDLWRLGHSQNYCSHRGATHDGAQKRKGWGNAQNVAHPCRPRRGGQRRRLPALRHRRPPAEDHRVTPHQISPRSRCSKAPWTHGLRCRNRSKDTCTPRYAAGPQDGGWRNREPRHLQ